MHTVYEAEHLIDAHLARGRLMAEGIEAEVRGEALIGALGELPATGLVRVCVAAADVEAALRVIAEWQQDLQTRDGDDPEVSLCAVLQA